MLDFPIKINLLAWVFIAVAEKDGNNYTYLLKSTDPKAHYQVSYSSMVPLNVQINEISLLKLDLNCGEYFGINETLSDKFNTWITYKQFLCEANQVEVIK